MSDSAHGNDVPTYLIDPRLLNSHAVGPAKRPMPTTPVAHRPGPSVVNASYYAALPSLASGRLYNMPSPPPGLAAPTHQSSLPLTPPTSITPESQVIHPPNTSIPPHAAQHAPSNFPPLPPAHTPLPYSPPPPTIPPNTSPPKKSYRKTPLSELSPEAIQARQDFLAACDHDRQIFLDLLKEPNNGGLAPERVEALKKTFKRFTLSSLPGSAAGVEANKRARLQGMAEIAFLRAQRARMREYEDSLAAEKGDGVEMARGGEVGSEREGMDGEAGSEERVSGGVTVSYSLNGKACAKEDLEEDTSRYPPKENRHPEVAFECLSTQQTTSGPPPHELWRDPFATSGSEALSCDMAEAGRHKGELADSSRSSEQS